MKNEVIQKIIEEKIIVIVRNVEKAKIIPLAQAMHDGGIRLIEVTFSADGKESDEAVAEKISLISKSFEGEMTVGAGTVLTEAQVKLTHEAGGSFIISPDTNAEVIRETNELGMVSIPGAFTPTEIQTAHRAGADFVKLFPVANIGAGYVKAVKAPLSHVRLLGVGGVDESNMEEYFKVGCCGFGIGTNIVDKEKIRNNNFAKIEELAKKYVMAIKKFQS